MATKKDFTTQLHTIILTIGPTNCGKTYFCEHLRKELSKKLKDNGIEPNIQYVSSDAIRKQLLGNPDLPKHCSIMMETSYPAFQHLIEYIRTVTTFPVNAHFVIVDTTGMSQEFRNDIQSIAEKNHYNLDALIFNYDKIDDFHQYVGGNSTYEEKYIHKMINEQVKKLHQTVFKELGKNFTNKHYIKRHSTEINPVIKDLELYRQTQLNSGKKYFIIGDIHECIDEFKQLVTKYGFVIESDLITHGKNTVDTEIISVGDLVDKGNMTKETIEFFHHNLKNSPVPIHIVCGNHEHAVMQLLTGKTTEESYGEDFVKKCYSSYYVLRTNEDLRNKFLEIVSLTKPFYHFISSDIKSRSFYVNHSPCYENFIGKVDKMSIKNQRYLFADRTKPAGENVMKTISPSSYNYPFHIFGHLAFSDYYNGFTDDKKNNKIAIDTGCIHGNVLTGVLCGNSVKTPQFYTVPFMNKQTPLSEKLYAIKEKQDTAKPTEETKKSDPIDPSSIGSGLIAWNNLTSEQIGRIKSLVRNKINFISGTISPAATDSNELESLKKGLEYFYDHFKKTGKPDLLSVEPKFMGSRCNIYLFTDPAKCYMVTRNGHVINQLPVETRDKIYKNLLHDRGLEKFMEENSIRLLIVDSELMPWNAIGNKLIDENFKPIDIALRDEIGLLEETGFEDYYQKLINDEKFKSYLTEKNTISHKELHEKYGGFIYETFKELSHEMDGHIALDEMKKYNDLYHQQLEHYGTDGEVHIKPFGILKIVFNDGKEIIPNIDGMEKFEICLGQTNIYELLNNTDNSCILNLEMGFDACYKILEMYYPSLINEKHMEGIVIKPDIIPMGMAPFIKVRNPDYLTLIYGPDYKKENKYKKLVKQKDIRKKIKTSINEFNLGIEMLKVRYDDIKMENEKYIKTLVDFLFEEEKEKDIDPRL